MSPARLESCTLFQNWSSNWAETSAEGPDPACPLPADAARPVALKTKSPLIEESSHGVCRRLVSRSTPSRTLRNSTSTGMSGTLMFCRMCPV